MPLMTTTECISISACRQRCSCVSSTSASRLLLLGLLLSCAPAFSQTKDPVPVSAPDPVVIQQELRAIKPLDFVDETRQHRAHAEHLATAPSAETTVVGRAKSSIDYLVEFLGGNRNKQNKQNTNSTAADETTATSVKAADLSPRLRMAARIAERYKVSPERAISIVADAHAEAAKHGLDPILVLSVIATESSFNPNARSSAGAVGLMQATPRFHPDSLQRTGVTAAELHHPRKNIQVGTDILSKYLRLSHGNIASALQRYNGSLNDKSGKYSNKVFKTMVWLSEV